MPNPFSINRAQKPAKPKMPCTEERGFAHNWLCEDPDEGKVVAKCRYCLKEREYPAHLSEYESWLATVTLTDPVIKRTNVGTTSDYL